MSLREQLQSQRIVYPSERQRRALKKASAQRKHDQLKQRPVEVHRRHDALSEQEPAVKRSRKLAQRKRRTLVFLPVHLATVPFQRLTDFTAMAGDAAAALGRLAVSASPKYTSFETVCSEDNAGAAGDLDVLDPDQAADLLAQLKNLVSLVCCSLPGSATAAARETPPADALLLFEYLVQRFRVHVRLNESLLLWLMPHVGRPLYALTLASAGTPLESSPFAFLFGECRDRALAWRDLPNRDVAQAAQVVSVSHLGRRCWIDVRLARLIARTSELRVADDGRWAQLFAMVFVDSVASVPGSNRRQLAAQISCLLPLVQAALASPLPDPALALSAAMVQLAIVRASRGASATLFPPALASVCAGSLLDAAARYPTTALDRLLATVAELCQAHRLADGQLPLGPLRRFIAAVCSSADQPRFPFRDMALAGSGSDRFFRRTLAPSLMSQALAVWTPDHLEYDTATVRQFADAWADCSLKLDAVDGDAGAEAASVEPVDYDLLESAIHDLVNAAHHSITTVALVALARRCKPHDHPVGVSKGNPLARHALSTIRRLTDDNPSVDGDNDARPLLVSALESVGLPLKRPGRPPALIVRSHISLIQSTASSSTETGATVASSLRQLLSSLEQDKDRQSSTGQPSQGLDHGHELLLSDEDLALIRQAAVYALSQSPHCQEPAVQQVACQLLMRCFPVSSSKSSSTLTVGQALPPPTMQELVSLIPSLVLCDHRATDDSRALARAVAALVELPKQKKEKTGKPAAASWNQATLTGLARSNLLKQVLADLVAGDAAESAVSAGTGSRRVAVASLCSSLTSRDQATAVLAAVGQFLFPGRSNVNEADLDLLNVDKMVKSIVRYNKKYGQQQKKKLTADLTDAVRLAQSSSCSLCHGTDHSEQLLLDKMACQSIQFLLQPSAGDSSNISVKKQKKKKSGIQSGSGTGDSGAGDVVQSYVRRALEHGQWTDTVPRSVWLAQPSADQLAVVWLAAVGPEPQEQAVVAAVRALTLLTAMVCAHECAHGSVDPVLLIPAVCCPVKSVRRAALELVAALCAPANNTTGTSSSVATASTDPVLLCVHQYTAELTLDFRFLVQAVAGSDNLAATLLSQLLKSPHVLHGLLAPGSWPCMRVLDSCTLVSDCAPASSTVDFKTLVSGLIQLSRNQLLTACRRANGNHSESQSSAASASAPSDSAAAPWFSLASALTCLQRLFPSVARSQDVTRKLFGLLVDVLDLVAEVVNGTSDNGVVVGHVTAAGLAAVDTAYQVVGAAAAAAGEETRATQLIKDRVQLTSALARLAVAGTGGGRLCELATTVARGTLGPAELTQLQSMLTGTVAENQLTASLESLEPVITIPSLSPLLVNLVALVRSYPPSADYTRRLALTRAVQLASSLEPGSLADLVQKLDLLALSKVVSTTAAASDPAVTAGMLRQQKQLALTLLKLISSALSMVGATDGRACAVLLDLSQFVNGRTQSSAGHTVQSQLQESWQLTLISWAPLAGLTAVATAEAKARTGGGHKPAKKPGTSYGFVCKADDPITMVARACVVLHGAPAVQREIVRRVSTIFCQRDHEQQESHPPSQRGQTHVLSMLFVCLMFVYLESSDDFASDVVDLCAMLDPADVGPAEIAVRLLSPDSLDLVQAVSSASSSLVAVGSSQVHDQLVAAATALLTEHADQVSPSNAVSVLAELLKMSFAADDAAVLAVLARADPQQLVQFVDAQLMHSDPSSAVQLVSTRLLQAKASDVGRRKRRRLQSELDRVDDETAVVQQLYPVLLRGAKMSSSTWSSTRQHEFVSACEHVMVQFGSRPRLLKALVDAGLVNSLVDALTDSESGRVNVPGSEVVRAALLLWCSSAATVLGADRLIDVLPKLVPLFLRSVHTIVFATGGGAEADGSRNNKTNNDESSGSGSEGNDGDRQQQHSVCCSAAARALCSLIKGLPGGLLSPWMSPLLTLSLAPSLRADKSDDRGEGGGGQDLSPSLDCLLALASTMPPRVWPKPLPRAAQVLWNQGDWQGLTLLFRAAEATAANATVDVALEVPPLAMAVLDCVSRLTGSPADDGVQAVSVAAAQAYVALTLRLSEPAFRPLFVRTVAWAFDPSAASAGRTDGDGGIRAHFFFGLAEQLARCLKSLFSPFTKLFFPALLDSLRRDRDDAVWPSAAVALRWICVHGGVTRPSSAVAAGSKRRAGDNSAEPVIVDNQWAVAAVDALVRLLALVAVDVGLNKVKRRQLRQLVQQTVAPCLVALASSASSDQERRHVMKSVLMTTRHADKRVRLTSLSVVAAIFGALTEDSAMSLIPDAVPFLAELADDPNSDVAVQATNLVNRLEAVLGEGALNTFF